MANFSGRLCEYPVVSDSIKVASNAFSWISSGDYFKSIFELTNKAADVLKSKASSIASIDAVTKLDEIACQHILDRVELAFPVVKKPTEEVFGPIADQALTAAESYLEYFLPVNENLKPNESLSRYDRLMRLQTALSSCDKVKAAQTVIHSVYSTMQEKVNALRTTTSKEVRDAILANLLTLASQYQSAAAIAFPSFGKFVDGAVGQARTLITEMQQNMHTENISQLTVDQLLAIVNGLHSTLVYINESRKSLIKPFIPESTNEVAKTTEEAKRPTTIETALEDKQTTCLHSDSEYVSDESLIPKTPESSANSSSNHSTPTIPTKGRKEQGRGGKHHRGGKGGKRGGSGSGKKDRTFSH